MSESDVPERVKIRLWGKAAGRCQYAGCNVRLWVDPITQAEFNAAYVAHIVADVPGGPRGDEKLSALLGSELSNLMLLCDTHHRLVDRGDVLGHPAERLRAMKLKHERRVETVTNIADDQQSHLVFYRANIGEQAPALTFEEAARALLPDRYPADLSPIDLGLQNSVLQDSEPDFWQVEHRQLRTSFSRKVRPLRDAGELRHLSVFAIAPQPLLIAIGIELGDIGEVDVFQLRREPPGWRWEDEASHAPLNLELTPPADFDGIPALVLSVSGDVVDDLVRAVLGERARIWSLRAAAPGNDIVRSRAHLAEFRENVRAAFNLIKRAHGVEAPLHVFPALPVSLAVELGRVRMPKADLPMHVYDAMSGSFVLALRLGEQVTS
jgi:hypothetical protein